MKVFRFVIRAYPSPDHSKYHEWQKSTLVLFVAGSDPHLAEERALQELEQRGWIPESFELRDILIESSVHAEGGEIWEAYLESKRSGLFWLETLDALPMREKGKEVWGTGPNLNEHFVDQLIADSDGHRVTAEEANNFKEKNADYILGSYVLELKHLEKEGLEVKTRQQKIAELFARYGPSGSPQQVDPYVLDEEDFLRYWEIMGVPVQKRIKEASKQVKATIRRLGEEQFFGGVILLNTGFQTIPHDILVAMAKRYAAKDTSSISKVVVISSWTLTNGFDTTVNYGFHPHEPDCSELLALKDTFWRSIEKMMTQMITGELDASIGMQKPMSPTHFSSGGTAYTFGIPQVESTLSGSNKLGDRQSTVSKNKR